MTEKRKAVTIERADGPLEIGTLGDCKCADPSATGMGLSGVAAAPPAVKKPRRRRQLRGRFCLQASSGKLFNCYSDEATAKRVADRMRNGKFRVVLNPRRK